MKESNSITASQKRRELEDIPEKSAGPKYRVKKEYPRAAGHFMQSDTHVSRTLGKVVGKDVNKETTTKQIQETQRARRGSACL